LPAVETLLRLSTAIDPRPVYFWINGARIMAYDFAAWRIAEAGGDAVSPGVEERIRREQAMLALRHLDAAERFHPNNAELWIERAAVELNALKDVNAAAESYRRASEMPGAPYYAARLHAEMLRRAGRKAEALAWLVRLHPTLPRDDEAAAADVVLGRIRELERELGVPAEKAYRPHG
jgi:tetratricopeptide (TPR) repeat protein